MSTGIMARDEVLSITREGERIDGILAEARREASRVRCWDSFAKYAAAFFKMSCSSVTLLSSALSLAISALDSESGV